MEIKTNKAMIEITVGTELFNDAHKAHDNMCKLEDVIAKSVEDSGLGIFLSGKGKLIMEDEE